MATGPAAAIGTIRRRPKALCVALAAEIALPYDKANAKHCDKTAMCLTALLLFATDKPEKHA